MSRRSSTGREKMSLVETVAADIVVVDDVVIVEAGDDVRACGTSA